MVNTECPYFGSDFEASPKRRRKCSSCKEQLYVVKDYYKVVLELLYKVKNELELNPDRYPKSDEYDIYSLRFHLLERLWYAGVLVNDKGDNPALFPGFFSKQINFEMSIKQFIQLFSEFPNENAPFGKYRTFRMVP